MHTVDRTSGVKLEPCLGQRSPKMARALERRLDCSAACGLRCHQAASCLGNDMSRFWLRFFFFLFRPLFQERLWVFLVSEKNFHTCWCLLSCANPLSYSYLLALSSNSPPKFQLDPHDKHRSPRDALFQEPERVCKLCLMEPWINLLHRVILTAT